VGGLGRRGRGGEEGGGGGGAGGGRRGGGGCHVRLGLSACGLPLAVFLFLSHPFADALCAPSDSNIYVYMYVRTHLPMLSVRHQTPIYMYICMYICIYIYMYIYMYMYVNIYIYIHTYIHTYTPAPPT